VSDLGEQLRLWADELRAIAGEGLYYDPDHPYHPARYRRVRRIAAELFAVQSGEEALAVESSFATTALRTTPVSGADGAVFDGAGRILLIQRADTGLWAMPGGALDVGETPAEGAAREVREETGLDVQPRAFVGVYDSRRCGSVLAFHLYHFVFLCDPVDPKNEPRSRHETTDVGWFQERDLPPLHGGHPIRVRDAFARHRGQITDAYFDR